MAESGVARGSDGIPSTRLLWFLVIALWLAEATGSFETAMIYAAQRALTDDLGDPVLVGWLITSYLLVGAGGAALAGRLGDLFGRKRLLILILAAGLVGSLMSAFAPNYAVLLAGRCIQGMTGGILPLCVGLTRENLSPAKVPIAIGFMMSGASAGTAGGLVIGGMIVDSFSWHGVFMASAAFALIALVAVHFLVPRSFPAEGRKQVNWFSGVLFVPAIFALLIAITYAPSWGLFDGRTILAGVSGLVLLALWIVVSLRTPYPLFEVRLFANRQVAIGNALMALVAMGSFQITLVFSLLLQAPRWTVIGLGVSATVAGLIKLPSNISSLAAGPLSGWLTARGGGRTTMIIGGLLSAGGWLLAMAFHSDIFVIGAILLIISFGTTILLVVGPTILATAVPHDRTSEAAGTMAVTRQAFMGVGAQLVSILLATSTVTSPETGASFPSSSAFLLTMGVIAALCASTALLALALPRYSGKADPAPQ
ncbi:MAG: MFS transporter [Sphingobium sp.]